MSSPSATPFPQKADSRAPEASFPAATGEIWFRRIGAVCTILLTFLCVGTLGLLIVRAAAQAAPTASVTALLLDSFAVAIPSVALGLPTAALMALFTVAYCPPGWRRIARDLLFVLSACPPILWAFAALLVVFPALEAAGFPATSAFTKSVLTLGLVVTPPLAKSFVEQLRALPDELVFAGRALGGSTFTVHRRVLWPAILPSACRAVCVALVRALGEGVALYLVLGLAAESHSLAAHLVLELLGSESELAPSGFAAAALLLVVTSLVLLSLVHALTGSASLRARRQTTHTSPP